MKTPNNVLTSASLFITLVPKMNVNTYLLKKNVTLCNQKECQCLLPQKSQYFVALKDWQHSVTQKYFSQKELKNVIFQLHCLMLISKLWLKNTYKLSPLQVLGENSVRG